MFGMSQPGTTYRIQTAGSPSQYSMECSGNLQINRAAGLLKKSVKTKSLETAWSAYMELRDLERVLSKESIIGQLHVLLPQDVLHYVVRSIIPAFGLASSRAPSKSADDSARGVYMFTKLFNYLLLVSRLNRDKRNEVSVMKLTMGQCMRRFISSDMVETAEDGRAFVEKWKEMTSESSKQLKLDMFDIYMMVMGAWKADRFVLVPYLYSIACEEWESSKDGRFQQVSAIVLSFYVREYGQKLRVSTVREMLDDLNRRSISLSPTHFSMLILYFGSTKSMLEIQRVLNKALEDPEASESEALYYNTFRAFTLAFTPQNVREGPTDEQKSVYSWGTDSSEPATSQGGPAADAEDKDELGYIDELETDMDACRYRSDRSASNDQRIGRLKHTAEQMQAAKVCTSLFQAMVSKGVRVTVRTYRELIRCMVQLSMRDKAHKIFMFAVKSLEPTEINVHFVSLYLRSITRTTRHLHYVLRWYTQQNSDILRILEQFSRKELVDHFGIFNGDLDAFVQKKRRAAKSLDARDNSEFLHRIVANMRSTLKAVQFINCALSGHDPNGEFVGYNFVKLRRDASGLGNIEQEILDVCRNIHSIKGKGKWLSNKNIIHNLLPVLSGIDVLPADTPEEVRSIKKLVSECTGVGEFAARLASAGIENWDISLVDQFLRIKYLGLNFQLYARRRAALASDIRAGTGVFSTRAGSDSSMYWPSFMFEMSNSPMAQSEHIFLVTEYSEDTEEHDSYVERLMSMVPAAEESWGFLVDAFRKDPASRLSPRLNTVGIFSLLALWTDSWGLGQRVWSDVFRLMDSSAVTGASQRRAHAVSTPLQQLRVYKHYLQFLRATTLAGAAKRRDAATTEVGRYMVLCDDAITDMFMAMDRNGVNVSSGLLCQGIRAALEVGQLDISRLLEQWQLHREQTGAAQGGFMQQWFSHQALPLIPEQGPSSVLGLGRGEKNECPRLLRYIEEKRLGGRS
ncbi:hypothetical protein EV175_001620 [Coemansia sp. RSA 1933]|nr:hypothetical protein EV175_001620 [Coemansia sp. RSA 1933]